MDKRTRIVFWGSPKIAADFLSVLSKEPAFEVVACVTQGEKILQRQGKSTVRSFVHETAEKLSIPVFTPRVLKKEAEPLLESLARIGYDIFVVLAYGKILPQSVIDAPRLKAVNFHGSLLPLLRGASPIEHALLYGFNETGWTLQKIVPELDAGDILAQSKVAVLPTDTAETLYAKMTESLLLHGRTMLLDYIEGRTIATAQDTRVATHCGKIFAHEGKLDFTQSAAVLVNRFRAFTPRPGVFAHFRGKKIKLTFDLNSPFKAIAGAPGTLTSYGKTELWITCGDGNALRIESITPEGKKSMGAIDFLNGYRITNGDKFQ
ncbi:MAG: Methionyl-tRNA formyltransferase [Turneriella sp.]|nr:Methionyl-tRNA formyltransferase [Turneriella sp.]